MTTNTNAALAEAERLLRRDAESLREGHTSHRDRDDWAGEDDAKAGYDEYIRAADAPAALTTAAAVPPEGWVMVPVELAQRVQESLGEFLMDHGWSQRDMDTSDDFGAVLLAAAPKAEPVPAGEREELREGASYESMNLAAMVLSDCGHSSNYQPLLERVAGRIDRHVERLLTAQREDLTTRAQAAPAAVAGPAAYRVLRKRHDGEWVTDGRAWCDGVPTQDLVDDIVPRSDGWRIEYAFAAPTTQPAPVAQGDALTPADADQLEKVITDFEECGETDVPYAALQRYAAMGYLECAHYHVLPAAHEAIAVARAQAKEGA